MTVWLLVKKEIAHRKITFLTGVLSLVVATAGLVAAATLLRSHDLVTEQLHIEMERQLRDEMTRQEDFYRRTMRDMGYNVLVMHKDQSESELRTLGHPTTYMPYDDVWKLAHGNLETLNHLLPVLQEKVHWPESGVDIMLTGIRGQVPVFSKPEFLTDDDEYRSPITERVPDGSADIGYALAVSEQLTPGDAITIMGETFEVHRIYPQRGTSDDITIWIPLDRAQHLLQRDGKINGIFALECVCDLDDIGGITKEVTSILPHTKVFEFTSLIAARAHVRQRAEEAHSQVVFSVMSQREAVRSEKERFASVIIPLLAFGAGVWIFLLIYNNMRERRTEIGVFRAVGYKRASVLNIFLIKALIMGLAGGILGCLSGAALGYLLTATEPAEAALTQIVPAQALLAGLLLAPALAFTAGILPAVMAANQDPAVILREE